MAPPAAVKNFQQHQPITTALRQICESYPAATCLRELLQNADDAQATEIEYVLDTNTYDTGPLLLHDDLKQYHGPALLARNNSVFSDQDFQSLSSIGDSRKRQDAASTGKFGQGFNSCFHWTDGPWVYSRQFLLLLDPHERWSVDCGTPGGPTWDIVKDSGSIEIQNHMKTFSAFDIPRSQPFDGTIIRIPLRTKAQAATSKIVDREVTLDQISKALSLLGHEVRQGGLLFLKHIRRMVVRIDDEVLWKVEIQGRDALSDQARREVPNDFKNICITPTPSTGHIAASRSFYVDMSFAEKKGKTTQSHIVHHFMKSSSGDIDLDQWSRGKKLFAWVAIAAPIDQEASASFSGRLFSVLRLPIETNQPVHIHGLFSITPDRGRLSSAGQSPGYVDMETKWNDFMFSDCVAEAWTNLLVFRKNKSWSEEGFNLWPRIESEATPIWNKLDTFVIRNIIRENMPVWCSGIGCIPLTQGYFGSAASGTAELYLSAFASVQLPAVWLPPTFFGKMQLLTKQCGQSLRLNTPESVRLFLSSQDNNVISTHYSPMLLQYCLLDLIGGTLSDSAKLDVYQQIDQLQLWPTLDGSTAAIGREKLLLPRDSDEAALFMPARYERTLDLDRLTSQVSALIHKDVASAIAKNIAYRGLESLESDWPLMYQMSHDTEAQQVPVPRDKEQDWRLNSIWAWIVARYEEGKESLPMLLKLWLVPVKSGHIRQLVPQSRGSPILVIEKEESLYWHLQAAISQEGRLDQQILDCDALSLEATTLLRSMALADPSMAIASSTRLESFVPWLVANRNSLSQASDKAKVELLTELERLSQTPPRLVVEDLKQEIAVQMRQLPLFNRLEASRPFKSWCTSRTNIEVSKTAILLPPSLPPLCSIAGTAFYDFPSATESYLNGYFGLVENIPLEKLLFDLIIPSVMPIEDEVDEALESMKYNIVDYALDQSRFHGQQWAQSVQQHAFIPVQPRAGERASTYGFVQTLVDPTSDMAQLFFADEKVFPEKELFRKHRIVLSDLGLKRNVSWDTPLQRARYYAIYKDPHQLLDKISRLLALPLDAQLLSSTDSISEMRKLRWLPAIPGPGKPLTLLSPNECRAADQRDLVDHVLGVFEATVKPDWTKLFGWETVLDQKLLIRQLDACLNEQQEGKVDQVLKYMQQANFDCSFLQSRKCIRGVRETYLLPSQAFLPGCLLKHFPLDPYLDEVDGTFAKMHSQLLPALGLCQQPSLADLLNVQSSIASSETLALDEADMSRAIAVLEIASRLPEINESTSKLMIPDTECKMQRICDVVTGETGLVSSVNLHFVHPAISSRLAEKLGVETVRERATRLELEIDDEDEDEYIPRERLTTIISDTLGRYQIRSTFSEFLANAEDCQASKISWSLDPCREGHYSCKRLLTEKMQGLQGPALCAYNDGVFSSKDFEGYKDIGRGGKSESNTSIGLFGRGSMSMYHFTDNPMILSGDSLLILDPKQQMLPKNKHLKRKVGVKMTLSKARLLCPDQLAPFDGLYSYNKNTDFYHGTIFRMPLNGTFARTPPLPYTEIERLLVEYYETARASMQFLWSISEISFSIQGQSEVNWTINASRSDASAGEIFQQVRITGKRHGRPHFEELWRIVMTDIDGAPPNLITPIIGKLKVTECGIAACISRMATRVDGHTSEDCATYRSRLYNRLPTDYEVRLPVSINGTFGMTGDRRTITINEEHDPNSGWNRWLLETCIPELYIEFLKDLAPKLGPPAFQFWPSGHGATSLQDRIVTRAFWEKIAESRYEQYSLFPLNAATLTNQSTPLKTRQGGSRKLHEVTTLCKAEFDNLPEKFGTELRPLFATLCSCLVRPPGIIMSQISSLKGRNVTSLDSRYLCQLFKDDSNCARLEAFLMSIRTEERIQSLGKLLSLAIPDSSVEDKTSMVPLSGCRILPMLDGSLKLLKLVEEMDSTSESQDWAIVANSTEEVDIFSFAADTLVDSRSFHPSPPCIPPRQLLQQLLHAPLNVRAMQAHDIGRILSRVDSPLKRTPDGTSQDEWFRRLWKYLNLQSEATQTDSEESDKSVAHFFAKANLTHCAIYRTLTDGRWKYLSPYEFEREPCIVSPYPVEQVKMCQEITGLRLLDAQGIPTALAVEENNLEKVASFNRLQRALRRIQEKSKRPLTSFLRESLNPGSVKVMREVLFCCVVKGLAIDSDSTLRELPIWPRRTKDGLEDRSYFLAAKDALLCKHADLVLLPWVKNADRFVHPKYTAEREAIFVALKMELMTPERMWRGYLENYLPKTLSIADHKHFRKMLLCLQEHNITSTAQIAPDVRGTLRQAKDLYDNEDIVFKAAFSQEQQQLSRFIHPVFRNLRKYWIINGLRRRHDTDHVIEEDYLECVRTIRARREVASDDPSLVADAATVARYLTLDKFFFRDWTAQTWAEIAETQMFRVRNHASSERVYRQSRMQEIAQSLTICSLPEAAKASNVRICWSQQPMLEEPPVEYIYECLPSCASPSVQTVYDHLLYLLKIRCDLLFAETVEFLKDIQASYWYLQENFTQTAAIPGVRDKSIWLNVDTTDLDLITLDQIKSDLLPANRLCINSPADPTPYKNALRFLTPYEKLLKALGVHAVVTRRIQPRVMGNEDLTMSEYLISNYRRLREQGEMLDVTFEAQGTRISAHKVCLAGVSEYCKAQFSVDWGQNLGPEATIAIQDLDPSTLERIINFAYSGTTSLAPLHDTYSIEEIADRLDELLDLLRGADRWIMKKLHSITEQCLLEDFHTYIRADNVVDVKAEASKARAFDLEKACQDLIDDNLEFVRLFEQGKGAVKL